MANEGSMDTITAEFKDGRLQIVEMSPYDSENNGNDEESAEHILPDMEKEKPLRDDNLQPAYVQVVDAEGKSVQLDFLNLTLVQCNNEDGTQPQYRLVTNTDVGESSQSANLLSPSGQVTCVLQSSDGEEQESQDYVVVEGEEGPVMLLQTEYDEAPSGRKPDLSTSTRIPVALAAEINNGKPNLKTKLQPVPLEKSRKRTRKSELPPPQELMASPNFKLYLYECKICEFKCNALKELTGHRTAVHGGGSRWRTGTQRVATLQCARCPFRGTTHTQLMHHVHNKHITKDAISITECEAEGESNVTAPQEMVDVFVCGGCGFETTDKALFKNHMVTLHGIKERTAKS